MYNPHLEPFIIVADAGGFNKAAEELLIQTHRGLKLTEAGKSLYQDAKYIIGYCKISTGRI